MSTGSADPRRVPFHARRNVRFAVAAASGLAAWGGSVLFFHSPATRILMGLGAFFAVYLAQALRLSGLSAGDLRAHTAEDDEGAVAFSVLGGLAFLGSVAAVVNALAHPAGPAEAVAGLLAIPLGWATMHVLASHHYALLYYGPDPAPDTAARGGLAFPGGTEPNAGDFLYFAFGIGVAMSASDVAVTTTPMRRAVMIHAICSFFANAVILALAVNAAASMDF